MKNHKHNINYVIYNSVAHSERAGLLPDTPENLSSLRTLVEGRRCGARGSVPELSLIHI